MSFEPIQLLNQSTQTQPSVRFNARIKLSSDRCKAWTKCSNDQFEGVKQTSDNYKDLFPAILN